MAEASSILECPVCGESFNDPKLLKCNHVICRKCVVDWLRKAGQCGGCPLCCASILPPSSSDHDDVESLVDALPTDQNMVAQVESNKVLSSLHVCMCCNNNMAATSFCLQCNMKLCTTCVEAHQKFPAMKDHGIEKLDNLTVERLGERTRFTCKNHDRLVELYCSAHQELICPLCFPTSHRLCGEVKTIEEAAAEKRELFRHEAQRLREKETAMKTQIKKAKEKIEDMHTKADKVFGDLQQCVEEQRLAVKELIQAENDKMALAQLDRVRAATISQAGVLDNLVGSAPNDALLDMEKAMVSRLQDLEQETAKTGDSIQDPADVRFDSQELTRLKSAIAALGQRRQLPTTSREATKTVLTSTVPKASVDRTKQGPYYLPAPSQNMGQQQMPTALNNSQVAFMSSMTNSKASMAVLPGNTVPGCSSSPVMPSVQNLGSPFKYAQPRMPFPTAMPQQQQMGFMPQYGLSSTAYAVPAYYQPPVAMPNTSRPSSTEPQGATGGVPKPQRNRKIISVTDLITGEDITDKVFRLAAGEEVDSSVLESQVLETVPEPEAKFTAQPPAEVVEEAAHEALSPGPQAEDEEASEETAKPEAADVEDNAGKEDSEVTKAEMYGSLVIALGLKCKEGQWSPMNPEGKKLYDREFLLRLQASPQSRKAPALPHMPEIVLDPRLVRADDFQRAQRAAGYSVPTFSPNLFRSFVRFPNNRGTSRTSNQNQLSIPGADCQKAKEEDRPHGPGSGPGGARPKGLRSTQTNPEDRSTESAQMRLTRTNVDVNNVTLGGGNKFQNWGRGSQRAGSTFQKQERLSSRKETSE